MDEVEEHQIATWRGCQSCINYIDYVQTFMQTNFYLFIDKNIFLNGLRYAPKLLQFD